MQTLFLDTFGVLLRVQGSNLIIEDRRKKRILQEISPDEVPFTQIVINGHYGSASFEAIRWCMKNAKVPITWMSWTGNPIGVTLPMEEEVLGHLKVNQVRAYDNEIERMKIAREFVRSKIQTQRDTLRILGLSHAIIAEPSNGANLAQLMAYEANVADDFYQKMTPIYEATGFVYKGRLTMRKTRHMNAKTEISAMQNYAYGYLRSMCIAVINSAGLLPSVGFLHSLKVSVEALAGDYQELFRWLCDLAVLKVLQENNLTSRDFHRMDNYECYLTVETSKKVVRTMDELFSLKVPYRKDEKWFYQFILRDKAQNLALYLTRGVKAGNYHHSDSVLDFGIPVLPSALHPLLRQRQSGMVSN